MIFIATVTAPTNIAVIKYWGKASVEYNTPLNASLSVTLDQSELRAVTTVATSPSFTHDRLWLNGVEEKQATNQKRFRACIDGVKQLATEQVFSNDDDTTTKTTVSVSDWQTWKVHVSSYNTFPTAAGLASSAAGYAALVAALVELYQAKERFVGEFSTIARQGSGSACRSLYGGIVAWRPGTAVKNWKDSLAEPVQSEWSELRAVILVVNAQQKKTSSTVGMQTSVATSSLLQYRAERVVPERMEQMEQACRTHDFHTFAKLTMMDSNQFHATCLDTYPPIFYLNDVSRDIIHFITAYNDFYRPKDDNNDKTPYLRVAYTFDAGPNAVLYTTATYLTELLPLIDCFFPVPERTGLVDPKTISESNPALFQHLLNAMPEEYHPNHASSDEGTTRRRRVQQIHVTQAGPGPQVVQPVSLASNLAKKTAATTNLDLQTGLNCYHPSSSSSSSS